MKPEQELHLAIQDNDRKKVEELIDNGVDIDCLFYAWTPLQHAITLAIFCGCTARFVSDLVGNPEDRFSHDEVHMTGFEELGVYLIERGADIYKHSKSDPNPLEDAVKKNLKQIVSLLLEKGVNPNMTSTTGDPLIFHTLDKDHVEMLKTLTDGKVDVNCENEKGMSPLFLASQNGEARVSQVLLDAGADPNFQYPQLQKQTPLIVATASELASVVKVLLKNGADVNVKDEDGWTALWHAYSNNDEQLMTLLLKSGADKDVPNSDGQTLLEDAKENENDDVIDLLQKFGRAWMT